MLALVTAKNVGAFYCVLAKMSCVYD